LPAGGFLARQPQLGEQFRAAVLGGEQLQVLGEQPLGIDQRRRERVGITSRGFQFNLPADFQPGEIDERGGGGALEFIGGAVDEFFPHRQDLLVNGAPDRVG